MSEEKITEELDFRFPYNDINRLVETVVRSRIKQIEENILDAIKTSLNEEVWGVLETIADKFEYDLTKMKEANECLKK